MNCSDLLSVVVRSILILGRPASPAEILPIAQAMCFSATILLADIQAACDACTTRGVCTQCTVTGDATVRYEIRTDMLQVRWDNQRYWDIVQASLQDAAADPVNVTVAPNVPQFGTQVVFYDDFKYRFDFDKWYVARKQFGGVGANNGVVPLNVEWRPDYLILKANGDLYPGPIQGVTKVGQTYPFNGNVTRVGGGVFTQRYFGSGGFEVRAKAMPYYGAFTAFWTLFFQEDGGDNVNNQAALQLPGRPAAASNASFNFLLGQTQTTDVAISTRFYDQAAKTGLVLNDGLFHTYRMEWTSGSSYRGAVLVAPRVDYYIDDVLIGSNTTDVPTTAGRFWLATWFPDATPPPADGQAGPAAFVTGELWIDWVRITSKPAQNDVYATETYPDDGVAPMSELGHLRV